MFSRHLRKILATARFFSTQNTSLAQKSAPKEQIVVKNAPKEKIVVKNGPKGKVIGKGGGETLGKKLMELVYAKRSAVVAISEWKEKGRTVKKYELNRIVRELRKHKRYKHALEICEWMNIQKDIKLQEGDYAVHLDLIAKVRGLNSAEKYFEDLPEKLRGQPTCSALLHTYVQQKETSKAESLMKKMSECGLLKNALPYNHMISLYISSGELEKVPEMIRELKKNTSPDVFTYNLWLTACSSLDDAETAEKVFLELKKAKLEPDWVTYSTLTSLYIRKSLHEKAASTLKEMERSASRKSRAAYSSLISQHTNMGNKKEVVRIWNKLKTLFQKMSDAEYTCMISSLIKLSDFEEAEKIYNEWETVSPTGDSRVSNLLLAAYINKNQMELAESFHNRMVKKGIRPSYTTWELLTWGYLKGNQTDKVLECFKQAVGSVGKWNPDEKIIREVFKNLENESNTDGAENLLVTLRKAGHLNTEFYNLLLKTYVKAAKVPLIVAERMKMDNVQLDDETHRLIKLTDNFLVHKAPSCTSA